MPQVTVFTSCYNQADYLPQMIDSVLGQSFTDFEYLLINDGSTDATLDVMQSVKDPRVRVVDLPKQATKAMTINRSITEARGKYWVWAPADDILYKDLLSKKHQASLKYPSHVITSNPKVIGPSGEYICEHVPKPRTSDEFLEQQWEQCEVCFVGVWIPIFWLRKYPFPEDTFLEDFAWLLECKYWGIKFFEMPEFLQYKRAHQNRTTQRVGKSIPAEVARLKTAIAGKYSK